MKRLNAHLQADSDARFLLPVPASHARPGEFPWIS